MNNADLVSRHIAPIPRDVASVTSGFAAKAASAEIGDAEDCGFVDLVGSIAVFKMGHRPSKSDRLRRRFPRQDLLSSAMNGKGMLYKKGVGPWLASSQVIALANDTADEGLISAWMISRPQMIRTAGWASHGDR
jgi:hypothetical protein